MPALKTIRMTLTGPFEGKTKTFGNKYAFIDGVCQFAGNDEQILNVSRYFTRSYQVKTELVTDEAEAETDFPAPNVRQAEIIKAVNCVEKDKWVDLQSETPRPKVAAIKELTGDPTVTVEEIVEVIKTWLS